MDLADGSAASTLAAELGVPLLEPGTAPRDLPPHAVVLQLSAGGLSLCATGPDAPGGVALGFDDPAMHHRRRAGHNELLGRAVGWLAEAPPLVLDATAGLAADAYVLADLGCQVRCCERQWILAAALRWALRRASALPPGRHRAALERLSVYDGDARGAPEPWLDGVQVIYLDPMFRPARRRAAPGKAMQLLALLTDEDEPDDAAALLDWALAQSVRRVVVKRARRAPSLPGPQPSHTLNGRVVRFDVYTCEKQDSHSGRNG